ncbi:YgdB family protein [Pantoea sp. Mb-10]|uniref:DUF2509 family protein n=1 Tax=unclassified Pantoea TaxID=2630326 RepID=UPI001E3B0C93|nr:YgdB family protein [Pantoea sp. Mb-10]MCE0501181.1 YgdB family protein [Pantoea sp. Pb-8]
MKQQGNSPLSMVLLLMLLGGITLHAMRTQLSQNLQTVGDEQHYHKDYWQAHSALEWGRTQRWPKAEGWQCQSWPAEQWQSCLLRTEDNYGLLSGRGEDRALSLWRWVSLETEVPQAAAHGWIDFCPLATPAACMPQNGDTGL